MDNTVTTKNGHSKHNCSVKSTSERITDIQLNKSIEFERTKQDRDGLLKKNLELQNRNTMLSVHLGRLLEQTETRIDNIQADNNKKGIEWEPLFYCPEDANEYIDAAMYMELHHGRKNNRVVMVSEWLTEKGL